MTKQQLEAILLMCLTCGFLGIEKVAAVDFELSYNASSVIFQRGVPLRGSRCRPITFLDICDCSGDIDYTTFSRLPLLRGLSISSSRLNGLFCETFANLRRLETVSIQTSSINIQISNTNVPRDPIPAFRELVFENSTVSGLDRNALQDLSTLRNLSFTYTDIRNISADVFSDLTNIRRLSIRSSRVTNFDFGLITNLDTLEYLALYNVQTGLQIDYNAFASLPNLNTILFDPTVYTVLNFGAFRSLRTVEIVVNQGNPDVVASVLQYLSTRGILYRFVR